MRILVKREITAEEQRETLAKNLNRLLEEKGRKKVDVFNALQKFGVSETTVYSWFNAKKYPRIDKIQLLADYFGVLKSDITEDVNEIEKQTLAMESVITLPLFEHVAAGALAAIDGVTRDNVEHISLSSQFLGKYANAGGLFSMCVNGDSMNKVINHGEIIIAKKMELSEYRDGDIVIFSHNGEYSLKRYAPNEIEGFVLFKAESHDNSFKDIAIPKDTVCELKIHGKVIFCGSTF